jgi:hypothetical protein
MSITTRLILAACTTALMALPVASIARVEREHGAHVHGITTIDIAQDGKQLSIGFEMPGINAVGYEHPPHSASEQAQLDAALKILRAPADWLVPNVEARCKVTKVEVTPNGFASGASAAGSGQGPDDQSPEHHEHADIDVGYQFVCDAPLNLRSIDLRLIERFPGTHEVRVNVVSANGQAQEVFSTPHAEITFAPASP